MNDSLIQYYTCYSHNDIELKIRRARHTWDEKILLSTIMQLLKKNHENKIQENECKEFDLNCCPFLIDGKKILYVEAVIPAATLLVALNAHPSSTKFFEASYVRELLHNLQFKKNHYRLHVNRVNIREEGNLSLIENRTFFQDLNEDEAQLNNLDLQKSIDNLLSKCFFGIKIWCWISHKNKISL